MQEVVGRAGARVGVRVGARMGGLCFSDKAAL